MQLEVVQVSSAKNSLGEVECEDEDDLFFSHYAKVHLELVTANRAKDLKYYFW